MNASASTSGTMAHSRPRNNFAWRNAASRLSVSARCDASRLAFISSAVCCGGNGDVGGAEAVKAPAGGVGNGFATGSSDMEKTQWKSGKYIRYAELGIVVHGRLAAHGGQGKPMGRSKDLAEMEPSGFEFDQRFEAETLKRIDSCQTLFFNSEVSPCVCSDSA